LLLMLLITGSMLCFSTGVDSVEKAVGISAVANSHVEAQIEIADCGDKKACKLSLLVTYPGLSSGLAAPVVLFFSGFQMPRSWYDSYAEQLASSGGYAVVQYETSSSIVKPLIPDMIEVQFIPRILSFLAGEATNSTSPLYNRVDVSRVGLMGHSRGGKLAALALAFGVHLPDQTPLPACTRQQSTSMHGPGPAEASQDLGSKHKQQLQQEQQEQQQDQHRVHDPHSQHLAELQPAEAGRCQQVVQGVGLVPQLAAVLIDPVDSGSGSSPQDMQYPSAVEALTGRNRSAALIGAGVCGWCNPKKDGWRSFWPVLQSGWLQVVFAAGHLQFTDAKGAAAWAWDKFCGGKAQSHAEVQEFPVRAALAWFGLAFEDKPPTAYIDWSLKQQQLQRASFEIKTAKV